MKICIDNRERLRIPLFEKHINNGNTKFINKIELDNYKVSDYHTEDNVVGIEYKKDDFVESIFSGTLDKQLKELKDNFVHPYLFVGYDGLSDMISSNLGVNPDSLIGKLSSILARHNVTTIFVGDLLVKFTCDVIEKHYDGKTPIKEISYTPIRKKFLKREPSVQEIRHAMMEQIPNIGAAKVNNLLESFDGSVIKIGQASIEDLVKVKGVGNKIASKVKEVLN